MFALVLPMLAACVPPNSFREGGPADRLYPLAYGDTLWGVAEEYRVPGGYPAIAAANRIPNPALVFAGQKLRITTPDTTLPELPRLTPAPTAATCAMQALPARPESLSGCVETRCVDTARGGSVCACSGASSDADALFVRRPGAAPLRLPVSSAQPWWFVPELAPEPERSARSLVAVRAQLDDDPGIETVVSWRTHLGELGMAQGTALVVDDDGAPGAQFRADNFGVGSLLHAGSRCDILATEWELADDPSRRSTGWYLSGRRFAVARGELLPETDAPLVMRRLFQSFVPGSTSMANVRTGTPAVDLSSPKAFARSTEPSVELRTLATQRGTLRGARREGGRLILDVDGVELPVDKDGWGVRRLGSLDSGVLFPTDYAPADDASLRGRAVETRTYTTTWGDTWAVVWLR